ncbi:kinase-like domain protein [Paramyrothecium foliicola]|nr:kinase-like domain protein [Paramyrothecium foliicola]
MAPYDAIAKRDADDERMAFASRLLDVGEIVVAFVDSRLNWERKAEYNGLLGGSFNISMMVRKGDSDEKVIIRFPAPKKVYESWRDEKVRNEVMAMNYLREETTIPVPRVLDWGTTELSPENLGPFIIMEYVEELIFLDPNIDEVKLDTIYGQLAGYLLELSRLDFPRIGAISKDDPTGEWAVTGRPLTYDMNEVATVGACGEEPFAYNEPFNRASEYLAFCAGYYLKHLETQRNIAGDDEDLASNQFTARHEFARIAAAQCEGNDTGPFRIFCDDLRPSNMLIDPETLRMTAIFDFEFTNAMPAQYTYDVPWWLLLQPPAVWLRDDKMEEFCCLFKPRMEQFIRAMERAEAKQSLATEDTRLSTQMRKSRDSGRFWFNLASRCSFDVDDFYWQVLRRYHAGEEILDQALQAERTAFVERKMLQVEQYLRDKGADGRFDDEDEGDEE